MKVPLKENLTAKIVRTFTFNKALSYIILSAVILFGTLAYVYTPKQYNPEITRPAFSITIEYPGARAEEVEEFITKEIVERINDIRGVDEINAMSYDGGKSVVYVIFDVGENTEEAKVKLYTKISRSVNLPYEKIKEPVILDISPDDVPIVGVAFYSYQMNINEVRSRVYEILKEIRKVPGVANLNVHGGNKRALLVKVDPESLWERNLSIQSVIQSIQKSNTKQIAGSIRDDYEYIELEVDGTVKNSDDARRIQIAPNIELQDVATVEDSWTKKTSFTSLFDKTDGEKQVVYLSIAKRQGANAPSVSKSVIEKINRVVSGNEEYKHIQYEIVRNDGLVAQKEINGLALNLITSIVIVGVILVLFLSYRPAIVVMTAIPLTLFLVFFVTIFSDQTINRITLFALILSLGLLVDSATVVVENIYRHIKSTDNSQHAIIHAVQQVGVGLILSTVTSVVVFLPVSQITGMMGPYMGPLAFFVPLALIMSLIVAFVITPFLSKIFFQSKLSPEKQKSGLLSYHFEILANKYGELLKYILYKKKVQKSVIIIAILALLSSFALPVFGLVKFQMLPKADRNQFYIYIDAPDGTDVLETKKISNKISNEIIKNEYVKSVQSFVGEPPITDFNGMFKNVMNRKNTNNATLKVNLQDKELRKPPSSTIASNTRKIIKKINLPENTSIKIIEDPPGPPVSAAFVAKVFGKNTETRERLAIQIKKTADSIYGMTDLDTSIPEASPKLTLNINPEKALQYGVKTEDISNTINALFGPITISQYHAYDLSEYAPIQISLPYDDIKTVSSIERISIMSSSGSLVPLSSVSDYSWKRTYPPITTEKLEEVTYVTGEMDNRPVVYSVIDMIKSMKSYSDDYGKITDWNLWGMTYTKNNGDVYEIKWGGEWEMTLENFRDLGIAMIVALFLVYGILVAQYGSFRVPGLIMTTVPFGLVGILPGFFVLGKISDITLTATALIGFIALIGIVVNNAILYLEYFEEIKQDSPEISDEDALIESGKVRLRPIMLTSLTTVLSSITIASDPVWSGLAWSIIFGLSLSTVLTLIIFPTLYILTNKTKKPMQTNG